MKNLYILKSEKPSILGYDFDEDCYHILSGLGYFDHQDLIENRNIFIASDEAIKEGQFVYCHERNLFGKVEEIQMAKFNGDSDMLYFEVNDEEIWCKISSCQTIALTTDADLIKEGVQAIDDEFVQWLAQNPQCESVKIRKKPPVRAIAKGVGIKSFDNGWKIIMPKSDLASNLKRTLDGMTQEDFDKEWSKIVAEGFEGPSFAEKEEQRQHIRSIMEYDEQLGLYEEIHEDNADKWRNNLETIEEKHVGHPIDDIDKEYIKGFNDGAKWHAENSDKKYSEEDMIEASMYGYNFHKTTQFPQQEFEESCIRNTQQWLYSKKK